MTVTIHIHGESAAQAIAELRAIAQELSPNEARVDTTGVSGVVGAPSVGGGETASEPGSVASPAPSPSPSSTVVEMPVPKRRGRPSKQTPESPAAHSPSTSPPVEANSAAKQDVPSPSPVPAAPPATSAPAAAEVSDGDMRSKLQAITVKFPGDTGLQKVLAIIKEHAGAEKVKDIKPEFRAAVFAAAEAVLKE